MSKSGRSLFIFSFYVMLSGLILLIVPKFILGFCGLPENSDTVARILGMVVFFLGTYYFRAGRHIELREFYRWTVMTRMSAIVILGALVVFAHLTPWVLVFGGIDFLGGLWTLIELNKEQ